MRTTPGVYVSAGTTAARTGTIVFSNSNGFSFGIAAAGGSQILTANVGGPEGISAGTQIASSASLVFSNSNGFTFGMSNNSVVTASFQDPGPTAIGAGTQTGTTGSISFVNSNSVSFGLSFSSVLTASNANGAQGWAAGTQTATAGTIIFSNSNGVSFGLSNSSVLTATVINGIQGIAAGTQTASAGTVVFSNSNQVTFGMSGSSQITASAVASGNTLKYWDNGDYPSANWDIPFPQLTTSNTLLIQHVVFPHFMNATQFQFYGSMSTTASYNVSVHIYTINGTSASRASSASMAVTFNNSNASSTSNNSSCYAGNSGAVYRIITFASWNITPGEYLLVFEANSGLAYAYGNNVLTAQYANYIGTATSNSNGGITNPNGFPARGGLYSTTTNAVPTQLFASDFGAGTAGGWTIPSCSFLGS